MSDTMKERRTPAYGDQAALTSFADEVLPSLQLDDGLFCFDRTWADPTLRGSSVRYSIMVLLGLTRRASQGGVVSTDIEALHRRIHREGTHLGVGDLGLLLWADTRLGDPVASQTLALLERRALAPGALDDLVGMEIGWLTCGAVAGHAVGLRAGALVVRAIDELQRRSTSTPLFRHTGAHNRRAALPNFATQVYALLALTELARHDLDSTALARAVRLADRLVELQRPDGGWPWLFNADRGAVVEPYEIYSVHQDAMAPMAFFALDEVLGEERYRPAVLEGLRWCFGHNELSFNFYDAQIGFAHRSIRRRRASARIDLWANAALGSTRSRLPRLDVGGRQINPTCRPYHLGWILEAWSR